MAHRLCRSIFALWLHALQGTLDGVRTELHHSAGRVMRSSQALAVTVMCECSCVPGTLTHVYH